MADCFSPSTAVDFASKDTNRIVGKIGEVLARKSPYMDILSGGILENVSEQVRSVVQEQAVMGQSLIRPSFVADTTTCGTRGQVAQVGTTEYTFQLESLRGVGPRVCVKTTRTAFKDSYLRAQQSLEKGILKIMNADIRQILLDLSGCKMVIRQGQAFSSLFAGSSQALSTPFPAIVPDSALTFRTLYKLATVLREDLLVDPFESDSGTMFKYIGSIDSIENFRRELDVRDDLRAFVTGKYTIGDKSLNSYAFQGPWRNIGFGVDSQPLRASGFNGSGQPILVEPEISVASTKGVAARINPAWSSAPYEIGFLIGADSFFRLTPETYTGEASFKFSPQLNMGELQWTYIRDNDCNLFGDFGQHIYQISRAYRPERPHAVVPIIYRRCQSDLGLAACITGAQGL